MSQILFLLSGSIAAYKACDAISQLVQRGHAVRTVATAAAQRFVGVATLEGLTGAKVGTDLFESGAALDHITLARWADLVVVCPATAATINRMAAGIGDDLAGALLLAHDWAKPLLVAPAMNPLMRSHPATTAAVERLRGWGVRFIEGEAGRTACGEQGEGRLAEPAEIVAAIEAALVRPARRLRVLITSGGTAEPIDGVRVITNSSTGATGALIATQFARAGHEVVLLRARQAMSATGARTVEFTTFTELDAALAHELGGGNFDAVIHAAAVSDFAVETVEVEGVAHFPGAGKLESDRAPVIHLRPNPKLLDALRARSRNPEMRVVAFKLTRGADPAATRRAVRGLLEDGAADFVVHNDLAARLPDGTFPASIWRRDGVVAQCADRAPLAAALVDLLMREVAGESDEARPNTGIDTARTAAHSQPPTSP